MKDHVWIVRCLCACLAVLLLAGCAEETPRGESSPAPSEQAEQTETPSPSPSPTPSHHPDPHHTD